MSDSAEVLSRAPLPSGFVAPDGREPFKILPFPTVPDTPPGFAAAVEAIAESLHRGLQRDGVPESTRFEKDLLTHVETAIEQMRARGELHQIAPLLADPTIRSRLRNWSRLRASLLWPLSTFLYWPNAEEVTILAWNRILTTIDGRRYLFDAPLHCPSWSDEESALNWCSARITTQGVSGHRTFNEGRAAVEFTFSRFRFALVRDPILSGESRLGGSIRIPSASRYRSLDDFVAAQTMSPGMSDLLAAGVEARLNILVCGVPGSAKTTLLRALARGFADTEHVVVVEDAVELNLHEDRGDGLPFCNFVTPLATVPHPTEEDFLYSLNFLVKRALRYRADRLVVGEVRGTETNDMIRALTTGHRGCLSTVHANSAREGLDTLVNFLCERGDFAEEQAMVRVRQAIDLVVHMERLPDGRRVVSEIVAVGPQVGGDVTVYSWDPSRDFVVVQQTLQNLPEKVARALWPLIPGGLIQG